MKVFSVDWPLLLAFSSKGDEPFYVPLIIFGLLAATLIALVAIGIYAQKKRGQALQAFAAQNGWTFASDGSHKSFDDWNAYALFTRGNPDSHHAFNFLQKPFDGRRLIIFDYGYRIGNGKSSRYYTQTVFAFHTPRLNLPYFALYPKPGFSIFSRPGSNYNALDFTSYPKFSGFYRLDGNDESTVRQLFRPPLIDIFEQLPDVNVDGGQDYLFVYKTGHQVDVRQLRESIDQAIRIYGLFTAENAPS